MEMNPVFNHCIIIFINIATALNYTITQIFCILLFDSVISFILDFISCSFQIYSLR